MQQTSYFPIQDIPEALKSYAPWSGEEVSRLNQLQEDSYVHPYTSETGKVLTATENGWVEKPGGPVVLKWVHAEVLKPEESLASSDATLPAVE